MKSISQYLTTERNFVFNGNSEEFSELLKKAKWFSYSKIGLGQLEFYAESSVGVLLINGLYSPTRGICVEANLQEVEMNKIRIQLNTSVRIEHYIIAAFFLIFAIVAAFTQQQLAMWQLLFFPLLWVLCHLWFRIIYQSQEEVLIENIVTQLNLRKE